MAAGTASVPDGLLADVIDAADECPGECIFIETD
jgi:ferredoxin